MEPNILFTLDGCESCAKLKKTLKQFSYYCYEEIDIEKDPDIARNISLKGVPALYNRVTKKLVIGNLSPKQIIEFFT